MYRYDQLDQQLIEQRSHEFRQQVERRLAGDISEEEFKPLRLMNGMYLQLHAYMLRVAIPYGILNATQLNALADIADQYDRGYGHFTTRQNIQFNWPKLVETPDILDALAAVQMHAIQTSGNCIRNITTDPFAGVAADEDVDPRPLAELLRQWSTLHPEFAYLPRKFKFAITGSANDRAAIKLHDIGLHMRRASDGNAVVDVWVGGGQGRTPKVAQLFRSGLSQAELLPYIEALMRVYNQFGRRDNKYKARIKILLSETGLAPLQAAVDEAYKVVDRTPFTHVAAELARITEQFEMSSFTSVNNTSANNGDDKTHDAPDEVEREEFERWQRQNVKRHRLRDHAIVVVSLKPIGGIPGDVTSQQMRALARLSQNFSNDELRVTHRQNLVLPYVRKDQLLQLWRELQTISLAESNIDLPSDIIACPGLDYCALATARSIPIAQEVSLHIREKEKTNDLGGVSINISGCINACAHHHIANIGVLGLDRGGIENYQITLGGRSDEKAQVGERMGPGISGDEVPMAVERVIDMYLHVRQADESFSDTYDRLGKSAFKDAVYAPVAT